MGLDRDGIEGLVVLRGVFLGVPTINAISGQHENHFILLEDDFLRRSSSATFEIRTAMCACGVTEVVAKSSSQTLIFVDFSFYSLLLHKQGH